MPQPTIGRIVIYRSRTGDYDVPAIINCTRDTLAAKGVEAYQATDGKRGVPPLSTELNVHLTVLTPGKPGERGDAADFKSQSEHGISENVAGCYQEWDIPPAPERKGVQAVAGEFSEVELDAWPPPGTWRWPERV